MRQAKWLVVVVGVVALALGAGVFSQAQQGLSGEYKIGILEPLTGNLAAEGKREQNRRLERMEDKIDALTNAVAVLIASKSDDKQAAPAPSPSPAPKKKENR